MRMWCLRMYADVWMKDAKHHRNEGHTCAPRYLELRMRMIAARKRAGSIWKGARICFSDNRSESGAVVERK